MEDGTVILVGATTENPSFELNAALLSRARVLTFKSHDDQSLAEKLLKRAETVEEKALPLTPEARVSLLRMADGDGRAVLTLAEEVWRAARPERSSIPRGQDSHRAAPRALSTTRRRMATTI
jgi:putative ATPase